MEFLYKHICIPVILLLILLIILPLTAVAVRDKPVVFTITVEDTVTAGTAGYIEKAIKHAEASDAEALVIILNTPGGVVDATLDIIQAMLGAEVPVITYVSPRGAISASAGTFILLSGHIAAMSPGTTCGAAMPVNMGLPGQKPEVADQKTINFLAGHMKSTARERGRPGDLAERFVTENLSLTDQEALDNKVIDIIAPDLPGLLADLEGRKININGDIKELKTAGADVKEVLMSLEDKFINIISNPMLAAVFLILGIYGLIIGFSAPGTLIPEVLGSLALILGLLGTGLFTVNFTAILLLLLGVGMLIAEAYTPTYGVLGVGGAISIVMSIILFPVEPLMPAGWFTAFKTMALGVGVIGTLFIIVIVAGLLRLRRLQPAHGNVEFQNTSALVVKDLNPEGQVRLKGEIWKARSRDKEFIEKGKQVQVIERTGIVLLVKNKQEKE